MSRRSGSSGGGSNCLVMAIILMVAAPLFGIRLLLADDPEDKTAGAIILAVCAVFYLIYIIYVACN